MPLNIFLTPSIHLFKRPQKMPQESEQETELGQEPETPQDQPDDSQQTDTGTENTQSDADEELQLLRTVVERQTAELQNLRRTVESTANRPVEKPETPAPNKEEDPAGFLEHLIRTEVSPVREFAQEKRREEAFANSYQQILSVYPGLTGAGEVARAAWNQIRADGIEPTPQAVERYVSAIVGKLTLDTLGRTQPKKEDEVPAKNPSRPPNSPRNTPPARKREKVTLTESQRRAMKLAGFAEGQEQDFLDYLQSDVREINPTIRRK